MRRLAVIILIFFIIPTIAFGQPQLIDTNATKKTQRLYAFLASIDAEKTLFGHQDDLLYGIDWSENLKSSDVQRITGDFPAVFGWDIGNIGNKYNLDTVQFSNIIAGIKIVYKKGGINTISWHMNNPITEGTSWEVTADIKRILPGGDKHEEYLKKLDLFADFINDCKIGLGTKIPIVFRPFHEHNGDWFWWGKKTVTEQEYISLWQFTVDYLRNERKINQLIYAFSPDRSRMNLKNGWESYHYAYPGDGYVDIIGLDNYWDLGHRGNKKTDKQQYKDYKESIRLISEIAKSKNKIAALTETGNSTVAINSWFTKKLLPPIESKETKLAWVLVWRNANKKHFFVPYKGHHNEKDFSKFEKNDATLFLNDINNPYKAKR